MPFPTKEERKKCWETKDAFWECLDKNNDDTSKCTTERQKYEGSCIKQWVQYFDRRRDYLQYREKMEKMGPEPLPTSRKNE